MENLDKTAALMQWVVENQGLLISFITVVGLTLIPAMIATWAKFRAAQSALDIVGKRIEQAAIGPSPAVMAAKVIKQGVARDEVDAKPAIAQAIRDMVIRIGGKHDLFK